MKIYTIKQISSRNKAGLIICEIKQKPKVKQSNDHRQILSDEKNEKNSYDGIKKTLLQTFITFY